MYACNPDEVAYDGHQGYRERSVNSAYCTVFLNTLIAHPEITVVSLITRVSDLLNSRLHNVTPQFQCNLQGDFMFQYGRFRSRIARVRAEMQEELLRSSGTNPQQALNSTWSSLAGAASAAFSWIGSFLSRDVSI